MNDDHSSFNVVKLPREWGEYPPWTSKQLAKRTKAQAITGIQSESEEIMSKL